MVTDEIHHVRHVRGKRSSARLHQLHHFHPDSLLVKGHATDQHRLEFLGTLFGTPADMRGNRTVDALRRGFLDCVQDRWSRLCGRERGEGEQDGHGEHRQAWACESVQRSLCSDEDRQRAAAHRP